MKIVLLGATGAVGRCVLKELAYDSDYELLCLSRRKIPEFENVQWKIVDSFEDGISEIEGDVWICCLGTTMKKAGSREAFIKVDFEMVKLAVERAAQTSAKQFHVVSAMGADPNSRIFYNQVKGKMEKFVESSGIESINIYRPSLIETKRNERRMGEGLAMSLFSWLHPLIYALAPNYAIVKDTKIANCIVSLVRAPEKGIHIIQSAEIQKAK